jgi:SAM-dependent methyltransferase
MTGPQSIDPQRVQAFASRMLDIYSGGMLSYLVDIGHRTGLFEAAARGPATSAGLAERAGLQERYVREWLGGMSSGGIVQYDPASRTYSLPPEHVLLLTGASRRNVAPISRMVTVLARHVAAVAECFRHGGGVPYAAYRPEFTEAMDEAWRRIYDDQLVGGFLPAVPGLADRLAVGMRVADIGCGTGHAINVLARAFPASTFVGYDLATDAIERARAEAEAFGLSNASFEVLDVATLPPEPPFDLLLAFDAIHDQAHPQGVLRRVYDALAADGTFYMVEFKFASDVGDNVGNPFAPLYYGISTLHCMTVSLAGGGPGLGAVWGREVALQRLAEAGFGQVEVVDTPRPQNYAFVCRK